MIRGLQTFKQQSEALKKQVETIVRTRVAETGMLAENIAKQNAPHDLGFHAQNIGHESRNSGFGTRLFANAKYAAFLEFGTGGLVNIPKGFEEMAAQFKGKGLRKVNMPARPHIIPAANKAADFLERKLKGDINKL